MGKLLNFLFCKIFSDRLKSFETYERQLSQEYKRRERILEVDYRERKLEYELVDRIFYLLRSPMIIGKQENKRAESLIIVVDNSSNIQYLYLFGKRYRGIIGLPRIIFEIKKDNKTQSRYLHIIDVVMMDNNIGNGSIAMEALISYSKFLDLEYISGSLSSVDDGHADRRDYYYKKFGFEFSGSRIKLSLKS